MREIQNSIWIDVAANMERVRQMEFAPSGLSLESYDIANALGSCLVDAEDLQSQLLALLKPKDQQHIDERAASLEALIVSAALNCCPPESDSVLKFAVRF